MEQATAYLKNLRISPRKLRFLLPQIAKLKPAIALKYLMYTPKKGARIFYSAIRSAINNAKNTMKVNEDVLKFETLIVEEGQKLKRYHPGSKGGAKPYKKRFSHIKIVLVAEKKLAVNSDLIGVKNKKQKMGQKVHPKGLRLGIIYNWNSRWFFSNKKSYRDALISDVFIRTTLMKKLAFASVTQIDIERAINRITLIIYAVKPGMIIGRGGKGLEELKKIIIGFLNDNQKKVKETKIDLKIEPVKKPYINAYYVAQTIGEKLIRGFPHRAVVHNTINRVREAGGRGVKIQLGGRIAGAEISRREKYFAGTIPTSTIKEDVEFARYAALTRSGYIGIKVWICK